MDFDTIWRRFCLGSAVLIVALATAGVLGATRKAFPHEAHLPYAAWYKSLKQPDTKVSCCDTSDCGVVGEHDLEDWDIKGDTYRVLVRGQWHPVPADKVLLDVRNPTGSAVLCAVPMEGGLRIYCFVPGALL